MRIKLRGLATSAKGPFGGDDRANKLATLADGTQIVQARKHTMTGPGDTPCHAWFKLCWIVVDAYWKTLPQHIRAEWGKCTHRTVNLKRSNLDEFRSVNIIRVSVGAPLLRLPPDRFKSRRVYLTNPPGGKHASSSLWISGVQKPEPPPPGVEPPEEEPDGEPFSMFDGSETNPLVAEIFCQVAPCPPASLERYNDIYFHGPWDFPIRPTRAYVKWVAQTNLEGVEDALTVEYYGQEDFFTAYQTTLRAGATRIGANLSVPAAGNFSQYIIVVKPIHSDSLPVMDAVLLRYPMTLPTCICKDGARPYIDRPYTLANVPSWLQGGTIFQTFNDDRLRTEREYIEFHCSVDVRCYFLYASKRVYIPYWLYSMHMPHWDEVANRGPDWIDYERALHIQDYPGLEARANLRGFPIHCRTTSWLGLALPWLTAWCCHLRYHSAPEVVWSDAYYWSPGPPNPPYGYMALANFTHGSGTYDWPPFIALHPGGHSLGEDEACWGEGNTFPWDYYPSTCWADLEDSNNWAGLRWAPADIIGATALPARSAGPAYVSHSNITCEGDDPYYGQWRFTVTLLKGGQHHVLEFKKPAGLDLIPTSGAYYLEDATCQKQWSMPCLIVSNDQIDWKVHDPSVYLLIFKQIVSIIASWFLGYAVNQYLLCPAHKAFLAAHYGDDVVAAMTHHARNIHHAQNVATWKCQVMAMFPQSKNPKLLADIAWSLGKIGQLPMPLPFPK